MNEITDFLNSLPPSKPKKTKPKKTKPKQDNAWRKRFIKAYDQFQHKQYPSATKDFGTVPPTFPDVSKSNGLTNFIVKFLTYSGHRASRINVAGRLIDGTKKMESGVVLGVKKWQTSTTRKGTADVSSTINGRSCMWEVKIGNDRPSEFQLREQKLERDAGGIYEFVKTPDEFLQFYDKIVSLM